MTESEKTNAVLRMQDYIHNHITEEIILDEVCIVSLYSKRHALRIFKELLYKTPSEYIRDLRLTNAQNKLLRDDDKIVDIAFGNGFNSHDGFTKAFIGRFGTTPKSYRKRNVDDDFSLPTPMSYYYLLFRSKGMNTMGNRTVTATLITRPARKLILKRGFKATGYFELCDEVGCDIGDAIGAIQNALDEGCVAHLPDVLILPNTSKAAFAIEVPLDFDGDIPDGCDIIELCEHTYLWFQGQPYEDENWYGYAHDELRNAVENYKPELYGYKFAHDKAPHLFFGATPKNGVKELIPVVSINK
ncbi:MAG: AraC family transcriptional regulator [Eubacteriales bacterium]|nr:AraC family transcriptional regulator [Eubacteriales bacterium]